MQKIRGCVRTACYCSQSERKNQSICENFAESEETAPHIFFLDFLYNEKAAAKLPQPVFTVYFCNDFWTGRFSAGSSRHFKQVFWLRRHRSGSLPGQSVQWHPAETLPLQRRGPRRTHTCFPLSSSPAAPAKEKNMKCFMYLTELFYHRSQKNGTPTLK